MKRRAVRDPGRGQAQLPIAVRTNGHDPLGGRPAPTVSIPKHNGCSSQLHSGFTSHKHTNNIHASTHTRIVTPANKYTYILTSMHTHAHVYILHVHTCMLNIHCHTVQSQCSQLQWWHSTSPTLASILDHMIMARNGTGACVHSSTPIPPFHPSMTPAPTPIH